MHGTARLRHRRAARPQICGILWNMPVSNDYLQYVLEQLAGLGQVAARTPAARRSKKKIR
jgi:hypothetical protein